MEEAKQRKLWSPEVEASLKKPKVYSFLDDLVDLCIKHNVSICQDETYRESTVSFRNWETFTSLEADKEAASLYWPRIQTDIIVRRPKNG